MKKRTLPVVLIVLALAFLGTGRASVATSGGPGFILPPPADADAFKHPKMESGLFRLAQSFQTGGLAGALQTAHAWKISLNRDNTVRVVLELQSFGSGNLAQFIVPATFQYVAGMGGRIETTYGLLVQASLPISALQILADNPIIRYVRRPLVPRLTDVVSEGVAKTGADILIKQPSFYGGGSGVKICILDLGFQGYSSLKGKELPSDVIIKSFRSDGDIQAGVVHGAACAEIVHDMAPNAKLYLVNFDTDVAQHNAVQWIVSQGVKVISYSIGWIDAGDGKGTGPIDADVEYAHEHGLVWAGSAGNEAEDHYEGAFSDPNLNRWHNFSPSDEILEFDVPPISASEPETIGALLNWDDWGTWNGSDYSGSNQDYDVYLYKWNGSAWEDIASSTNTQNGTQWPVEEAVIDWSSDVATHWGIAIYRAHTTRNCKLEVFIWGGDSAIEYNVPGGSLMQPADSPECVTAGATDCMTDAYHYYSSRGPTHDGRIKPDFGAPSGVSTHTYGTRNFYGTSASAPHVAGAFGLMMCQTPYDRDQIYQMLQLRAVDLGSPGKDNMFGWGRLSLKK